MHAVFHDWPDAEATTILTHTRDAMTKGYSKLFIYDIVNPAPVKRFSHWLFVLSADDVPSFIC